MVKATEETNIEIGRLNAFIKDKDFKLDELIETFKIQKSEMLDLNSSL
jgi:hypothetical protein